MITRIRPPESADERATMTGLLDFLRATVVHKVGGLTDEQATSAALPPSALSPASIVKHLTGVERFWFSIDFAGADIGWPWTDEDPHGAFPLDPNESIDELVREYEAECNRSRAVVADAELDDTAAGDGMTFTLRYVLAHLVEETARHCGHLDLLVERIDGRVGE